METSSFVPQLFALEITEDSKAIIALLNKGVTPGVEGDTFFIFDATWNSDMPAVILTHREVAERWNIRTVGPLLLKLEEPVGTA